MANGLLNQIYAPSNRQLIEEEQRRNPLFGLLRQQQAPQQHQAVPAKTLGENLLQRVKNVAPRTMAQIKGGAELLGTAPERSVIPKRGVPTPPFYDAGRTVLRNVAGLLGIAGAGVSGPMQALVEEPVSDQLQLKGKLSKGQADLAAMAATGLLPFGMGSKVWSSPLEKALSKTQAKGDAGHYISALKKEKGALAEAKMSGLLDVLESSPKHTREGLLNLPRMTLDETVKGDALDFEGKEYLVSRLRELKRRQQETKDAIMEHRSRTGRSSPNLENVGNNLLHQIANVEQELMRKGTQTKYGRSDDLNLPGGTNPKEILVQLPEREQSPYQLTHNSTNQVIQDFPNRDAAFEALQNFIAKGDGLEYSIQPTRPVPDYTGSHFDEPNILVHVRTNERDVGGKKTLHGEEFQSDWHQRGQKKGYVDADRERVVEGRISEIRKALKTSNQRIRGEDNVGLLKKLDGDTSGLNVGISSHPEGGDNFYDRNQNVANDYASIGHISREGDLSLTKYATPEQKILLEKHANLVKELNTNQNKLKASVGQVPDAPYKKNWHELGFKRLFAEAINDPSIERLTWTTGEVQAERYNLAKYISSITAASGPSPFVKGRTVYDLSVQHKGGEQQILNRLPPESLADHVGKEMADRIVAGTKEAAFPEWLVDAAVKGTHGRRGLSEKYAREAVEALWENPTDTPMRGTTHHFLELRRVLPEDVDLNQIFYDNRGTIGSTQTFSGLDLEVGGEFHKKLYNEKIPQFAKEFLKKYKVKPQKDGDFWYIDITPEMRQDFGKGVPLAQVGLLQPAYA